MEPLKGRAREIYTSDATETWLLATRRTAVVSEAINTVMERYRLVCEHHMPTLPWREWCAIFDALNGVWMLEGWMAAWLHAEVADTVGLGEKWEIDQAGLVRRLQHLSCAEAVAVTDAAERFWGSEGQPGEDGWRPMIAGIVGEEHVLG